VKYLTAIALFMGPSLGLLFVALLTVLAIGLAVAVHLLGRWVPALESGRAPAFVKRLVSNAARGKLPYGFPIGLAALILVPRIFSF
jgi:Flp pilus assembly protein protease CpaA